MNRSRAFKIGMILNILPFILGILYYNRLPSTLATHFGVNNQPNGYSDKFFALFGIPAIMILVYVLAYFFTKLDPKKENQNKKAILIILLFIPMLNVIMSEIIILTNLGHKINVGMIIIIFIGFFIFLLGNYMPKLKRNYTVGLKLPWILDSDENWDKTHRIAGYLWSIGGILCILAAIFFSEYLEYISFTIFVIIIIIPVAYSYIMYRRDR